MHISGTVNSKWVMCVLYTLSLYTCVSFYVERCIDWLHDRHEIGWAPDMIGWACAQPFSHLGYATDSVILICIIEIREIQIDHRVPCI